jgi:hypothetical protein
MTPLWLRFATGCALFFLSHAAIRAEPYLAVQQGLKCMNCHTSPSGGGKRTSYGMVFSQTALPAHTLDMGELWTGEIERYLAIGGDVRGGWERHDVPGQASTSGTELEEVLAYVEIKPFPKYLMLYVDAKLRPDDPDIREQYARLNFPDGRWSIQAGEFFLPYGLRLQDDEAFIRPVSDINFNTPDIGWQVNYEAGAWSGQLAVTRGTAGGPEVDSGKQYSLLLSYVKSRWRGGASFNLNDSSFGDRQMQNIFGGIRTGPVAWLAEIDYIIDYGTGTGKRKSWVSLIEANYNFRKGHNLRSTFEWFDPDVDISEDEQNRFSVVWEYTPIQFLQARLGYRDFNGIPQSPAQNRELLFAELHLFF